MKMRKNKNSLKCMKTMLELYRNDKNINSFMHKKINIVSIYDQQVIYFVTENKYACFVFFYFCC